jgi:subtilisin family serine protease
MASPYVAGLASLVWKLNPNLTNSEVRNLILSN